MDIFQAKRPIKRFLELSKSDKRTDQVGANRKKGQETS
jgi:hypothetical protein